MRTRWKKWAIAAAGALVVTAGIFSFLEWRNETEESMTIEKQIEELRKNGAIVENYYQGMK